MNPLRIVIVLLPLALLAGHATEPPPHIILVMADDQGWGDTGYNGHPFVQTPAMDAMSQEGLVFDRYYAAAPVCSPTRASVMTGRTPIRSKVPQHGRYMRPHEHTIAEALKGAGYTTGIFGKVHLGSGQPDSPCNPSGMGFDEWCIGLNFFDMDPYMSRNGIVERRKGKGSVVLMNDAIDFLKKHKDGDKPTFTVIWFPSPHDPFGEVPDGPSLYDDKAMKGYYREITLLDQQLGRLRRELDAMDMADNTLLWYTSDNGGLNAETSGGRMRKGSIYEGGLRVPSVAVWPKAKWQGRTSLPTVSSDLYPTLLAIAGVEIEHDHPIDGINLLPLLEKEASKRPAPIGFWHNFQGGQSTWSDRILKEVMTKQQAKTTPPYIPARMLKDVNEFPQFDEDTDPGHAAWLAWPWKLHKIRKGKASKLELYHLVADPMETKDLAADPAQQARVDDMHKELTAWMGSVVRSVNGVDYKNGAAKKPASGR